MDIRTRFDCRTLAVSLVRSGDQAAGGFFERAVRSLLQETLWALAQSGARWDLGDASRVMRDRERLRTLLRTTPEGQAVLARYLSNEEVGRNAMASVQTVLQRISIQAGTVKGEDGR